MQLCEGLLLTIIFLLGCWAVMTDIKVGIIKNKALLYAAIPGIVINLIYIVAFAKVYFTEYLINLIAVSAVAILLYVYHFWAAGDSKLLIVLAFLIPSRYYESSALIISGIYYIVYIFLIAYIYIIFESVVLAVKKKKFFKQKISSLQWKTFLCRYIVSYLYLRTLSFLLQWLFGNFYYRNQLFFAFVNIFTVLFIHERDEFQKKRWVIPLLILNVTSLVFSVINGQTIFYASVLKSYVIMLLALVLKYLVSGYNYEEIATSSVQKGMVISLSTIALLLPSNVVGLPKTTNEDMSSRITEEEAAAIRRWERSKYGKPTIVIVRKIPFAIFIVLGTFLYIVIRIVSICL